MSIDKTLSEKFAALRPGASFELELDSSIWIQQHQDIRSLLVELADAKIEGAGTKLLLSGANVGFSAIDEPTASWRLAMVDQIMNAVGVQLLPWHKEKP